MGFRLFLIMLLASVITYYGAAADSALYGSRVSWLMPPSAHAGDEKAKDLKIEWWKCKGVLVRSYRLRSRLNTHLLKLRFRT